MCLAGPRVPSLGTTGRLCDFPVLGCPRGRGGTSIAMMRPVKFVLAGEPKQLPHFGLSQSRVKSLISEIWGECFSLILRENSVRYPINDPRTLNFFYLNFHDRTLRMPRKNVSLNAQERAKPARHRQSTEGMLSQAAQRGQGWYAGSTRARSSCHIPTQEAPGTGVLRVREGGRCPE